MAHRSSTSSRLRVGAMKPCSHHVEGQDRLDDSAGAHGMAHVALQSGDRSGPGRHRPRAMAWDSITSPILVAVAWALIKSTSAGAMPASARARRRVAVMPSRFGRIRSPPLLLQAKPMTSPRMSALRAAGPIHTPRAAPRRRPRRPPGRRGPASKGRGVRCGVSL